MSGWDWEIARSLACRVVLEGGSLEGVGDLVLFFCEFADSIIWVCLRRMEQMIGSAGICFGVLDMI